MSHDTPLEPEVQRIGREILARAQPREGGHFSWLHGDHQEALLNRLMADERLRVQMLRFVDVLPALREDEALARHLDEYLGDAPLPLDELPIVGRFPGLADWVMRHSRRGLGARVLAAGVRAASKRMAGRFIAGHAPREVAATLRKLHARGMGFTLDLLGEATVSEAEADTYQRRYLDLLRDLPPLVSTWPANALLETISGRRAPRLNLSIKISALYSQIDPVDADRSAERVKARLRPILLAARQAGAYINLDMEQYDTKAITLRVFRELLSESALRDWPDAGIAMQAYLRDTPEDLKAMIEFAGRRGTPFTVRLVRGAYWDYETVIARQNGWPVPVWTRKGETDACYERCLRMLLEAHPLIETAVATHNVRSMAVAIATAGKLGLSPSDYEFQMLYGMADPVKDVLVSRGQRLRVYVPFGELIPGMAYLVRRLLENTSSQSFLRMGMTEDADAEAALRSPPPRLEAAIAPASETPGFVNEAVRRWTNESERDAFRAALERVRAQLGGQYALVIDGQRVKGGTTEPSTNPSKPEEVVGWVANALPEHANDAVRAAEAALKDWAGRGAAERVEILRKTAAVMRRRRDELAAWQVYEAGKPWREADADVSEAIDFCEYYAAEMLRLAPGRRLDIAGETNHYFYEPRGVGAVIAPWNFPLAIVTGMTAASVVAGNTVVVKPAPQTPAMAAMMVQCFEEAGLPPGVLNFLPGGDEVGDTLVRHPRVAYIAFTGSEAVGEHINVTASHVLEGQDHLKRVIAELGGKNAIIIDDDADLDDAVRGVALSAFAYAGQKCSACSRAIVVGDLHEAFVARLVEAARSLTVGPADDPGTVVGPVIDGEARRRIHETIDRGKREAWCVLETDVSHLGDGHFVGPTIFDKVDPDSFLAQQEIFGPVLAVMRARDFEHAIELANHTRYALTGGVYSRSPAHLEQARRRIRAGNLYLNRKITGAVVGRQPFGGFKMSGVGSKAGGPDYLLQLMEPRTITENTIRRGFAPEQGEAPPSAARGI